MRFLPFGFVCLVLLNTAFARPATQDPGQKARQPDHFFSGVITALTNEQITVSRTVLGKESVIRTFSITPETKVEGKPRVRGRVTVKFASDDSGHDKALYVIVRSPQQKKP